MYFYMHDSHNNPFHKAIFPVVVECMFQIKRFASFVNIIIYISSSKYMRSTIKPFLYKNKIQSHTNFCDTLLTGLVFKYTKENQFLTERSHSHLIYMKIYICLFRISVFDVQMNIS